MVIILARLGCYLYAQKQPAAEKAVVNAEVLRPVEYDNAQIYQGVLISRQSVFLQPQVAGQIQDINVKAGDKVNKGQLLLVIDPRKQEALLNSYKVKQSSLLVNYETAKTQFERYSDLYEKKTVSKQDLENYENAYKKAKSDYETNEAQIKEQTVTLGYHKITAPFTGTVGDIPVKVGDYVTPETRMLSVTQNETLELNVGLPADKVFDIKAGLPVQILDNQNNIAASSTLSFISPRVDSSTQTILTKAIMKNKNGILKADQSVKVRVIYNKKSGILIPISAKIHLVGQDFVFVIKDENGKETVKQIPVTLGEIQNDKYVVEKGLKSGDTIVIRGVQKLYDGAEVNVEKEEQTICTHHCIFHFLLCIRLCYTDTCYVSYNA